MEFLADLTNFFSFFNARLWEDCAHHCPGAHCCPSRSHVVKRGDALMRKTLFRSVPSVPAKNKWCKLGPVLDWTLLCMLCHSLLVHLMLLLQCPMPAGGRVPDDIDDESLRHELSFATLKGKRWKASTDFLLKPENVIVMGYLAFALEPLRFLVAWWVRTDCGCFLFACLPTIRILLSSLFEEPFEARQVTWGLFSAQQQLQRPMKADQ